MCPKVYYLLLLLLFPEMFFQLRIYVYRNLEVMGNLRLCQCLSKQHIVHPNNPFSVDVLAEMRTLPHYSRPVLHYASAGRPVEVCDAERRLRLHDFRVLRRLAGREGDLARQQKEVCILMFSPKVGENKFFSDFKPIFKRIIERTNRKWEFFFHGLFPEYIGRFFTA